MGCFKSKSAERTDHRGSRFSRSITAYSVPEFTVGTFTDKLSAQELADVKIVMNVLRTDQLDLIVVSGMFDKLFQAYPEIKQTFINAAFLDPDHSMDCTSDPWFQPFLKAYFNSIIKYILLQTDEEGLREFLCDLKENHIRIKGIEKRHLELMMQCLYMELVCTLGNSIDSRKRAATEHVLTLLFHDALYFLPLAAENKLSSMTDDASSARYCGTADIAVNTSILLLLMSMRVYVQYFPMAF